MCGTFTAWASYTITVVSQCARSREHARGALAALRVSVGVSLQGWGLLRCVTLVAPLADTNFPHAAHKTCSLPACPDAVPVRAAVSTGQAHMPDGSVVVSMDAALAERASPPVAR